MQTLFDLVNIKRQVTRYPSEVVELDPDKVRRLLDVIPENEPSASQSTDSENVFYWFDKKIHELENNDQHGNAECYSSKKNVYKKLLKHDTIRFYFFSVKRLKELEQQLLENGTSISMVGKHARNLRTVFNMAMQSNEIGGISYPFGRNGYCIPATKKAKKALGSGPLNALLNYVPSNKAEQGAVLYFTFSYFGNGMNLKGIATIKHRDVAERTNSYYRKKTRHTGGKFRLINLIVTEEMQTVMDSLADPNNFYLFPILRPGLSEKQANRKVHTKNKQLNDALKQISKKLQLDIQVTLGASKHVLLML